MEGPARARLRGGGRYVEKVEVMDPLINGRSGTFGIWMLLPNPDNKPLPDFAARSRIGLQPGVLQTDGVLRFKKKRPPPPPGESAIFDRRR